MKLTGWAVFKIALIVLFTIQVVFYRMDSTDDASRLGECITRGIIFLALFQLSFWFFYDVMSLKRGGWVEGSFGRSPFARESGPGLRLDVVAVALVTFGAAKVVSAVFQGLPSIVLGTWLLAAGVLLLVWQRMLRKLFRARFAGSNRRSDNVVSRNRRGHRL
jgi:L-lactate permease